MEEKKAKMAVVSLFVSCRKGLRYNTNQKQSLLEGKLQFITFSIPIQIRSGNLQAKWDKDKSMRLDYFSKSDVKLWHVTVWIQTKFKVV